MTIITLKRLLLFRDFLLIYIILALTMVSDLQLLQWCLHDVGKYDDAQVERSFIVALCLVRYATKIEGRG